MKMRRFKATEKQKDIFRKYLKKLTNIENAFGQSVHRLEQQMKKETGIEGVMFFQVDGEYVGIGDWDRSMQLFHRHGPADEEPK